MIKKMSDRYTLVAGEALVTGCHNCVFDDKDGACIAPPYMGEVCENTPFSYWAKNSDADIVNIVQIQQWCKKRFPKIKTIRQNEKYGVTVVKLKNGVEARTKLVSGDKWDSELGVMHAYVKCLESCEPNRAKVGGGFSDDITLTINGEAIPVKSFELNMCQDMPDCNEARGSLINYSIQKIRYEVDIETI